MNASLKVIENAMEFIYSELKNASNDGTLDDRTFKLLKEAAIDAINLKRKIETARAFNLK